MSTTSRRSRSTRGVLQITAYALINLAIGYLFNAIGLALVAALFIAILFLERKTHWVDEAKAELSTTEFGNSLKIGVVGALVLTVVNVIIADASRFNDGLLVGSGAFSILTIVGILAVHVPYFIRRNQ